MLERASPRLRLGIQDVREVGGEPGIGRRMDQDKIVVEQSVPDRGILCLYQHDETEHP